MKEDNKIKKAVIMHLVEGRENVVARKNKLPEFILKKWKENQGSKLMGSKQRGKCYRMRIETWSLAGWRTLEGGWM